MVNPEGLHIRAASLIAERIGREPARVELIKGNQRVDATNVLQIVSLCALEGEQLLLEATGQNADAALEALVELFESRFEENQFGAGESGKQDKNHGARHESSEAASDGDPSAR